MDQLIASVIEVEVYSFSKRGYSSIYGLYKRVGTEENAATYIMITIGIDYGASNVGISLVRTTEQGENIPLFAGTLRLDVKYLKDKVETRAGTRRLRRTRKTKKRRLQNLRSSLEGLRLSSEHIERILNFSKRRGYKSLFDDDSVLTTENDESLTYRFLREEFFKLLEKEIDAIASDPSNRAAILSACEKNLNRLGNRDHEIRQLRIDNRGVSRCAWDGCNNVTPRVENAIRETIAQQIFTVFQTSLRNNTDLRVTAEKTVDGLAELAKRLRHVAGENIKAEKKALRKKTRDLLRRLRDQCTVYDEFNLVKDKAWKKIESDIMNIMENRNGRTRYCRRHSDEYIQMILQGRQIPFKKTVSESDIISRREQIAYAQIWRYIEARILQLAPEGIDRVIVERTAFDLLAGSWKKIQGATDKFKEEMYRQGPMYGFDSVVDMLKEEFGGLCAYCGAESSNLMDHDHILPRSEFFFDSYLNILPACPKCNSDLKGKRSASGISLTVHPKAYEAYSKYLYKKFQNRPMHFLHTVKKGILNLMKDSNRLWEAERYLSIIAGQFARIVQTQRTPRPFARYLCSKLGKIQGRLPEIEFQNGRHTALYRTAAYPNFKKYEDKAQGNTVNHALDALILASELPSVYPLESLHIPAYSLKNWMLSVRRKAPIPGVYGLPEVHPDSEFIDGFETVDPFGYVAVDLRSMVWNRRDRATHKQDPYGWSEKKQLPTKRKAALDLYNELLKEKSDKVIGKVSLMHHPALKNAILERMNGKTTGETAAFALREWIRNSVTNSFKKSVFSAHPGDQARRKELENFISQEDFPIPAVIGIKMFDTGVRGKIDLERLDKQTKGIGHRYMTQPPNRAVIVAYPKKNGRADLSKPCCLRLRQNSSVMPEDISSFKPLPESLSKGRVFGIKDNMSNKIMTEIERYLKDCDFYGYVYLTPGCVIEYTEGRSWFVRNFDVNADFKKSRLRNIAIVRRSPFVNKGYVLKALI